MITKLQFKGDKYTVHIRDARECGGQVRFRISENELTEAIGVHCLLAADLSIDEIAQLIKNKE